jgi:hypothetical protein
MKTDLYTKTVLTVIAVMFSVIAANQFLRPAPARAASAYRGEFAVGPNGDLYFYQDGTGDTVKSYNPLGEPRTDTHLKDR